MGFKRIEITEHFNPTIGKGGLSVLWQQLNSGVHVLNEFKNGLLAHGTF